MAHDRLVRVSVYESGEKDEPFLGYAWGLYDDKADENDFLMLHTRSKRVVQDLGAVGMAHDISEWEIDSMVNVDECWTPNCVYVEAAKYALTGEAS